MQIYIKDIYNYNKTYQCMYTKNKNHNISEINNLINKNKKQKKESKT